MPYDPADRSAIRVVTLAQLMPLGSWQLDLMHDRAENLLIWITRGQGRAVLDGARTGVGAHNALFIPARHLMALDLGRQSYGQALVVPPGTSVVLPERPLQLRIREVAAQTELTALFEAMGREQNQDRELTQSALQAYGELAGIWLRRHLDAETVPKRVSAARRLSRTFCQRLVAEFANGETTAEHAQALNVTPTHLSRVCKSETGRTASALLTSRLLYAARQLLCQTDVPVQDIARHLGFGSAAYFTRFIQQHTAATPSTLRRSAA